MSLSFHRPTNYTSPVGNVILSLGTKKGDTNSNFLILNILDPSAIGRGVSIGIVPTNIITNNTIVPKNVIRFLGINEPVFRSPSDSSKFSPSLDVPIDIIPGQYRILVYYTSDFSNYIVSDIITINPGAISFRFVPTYNPGTPISFIGGNTYYFSWQYLVSINVYYTLRLTVVDANNTNIEIATIEDAIFPPYDLTMPSSSGYDGHITTMFPLTVPTGTYKLKLTLSSDYPVFTPSSGTITVTGAYLNLLSYPSLMYRNINYTVTWISNSDSINNNKLRIDLLLYYENIVVITLGTVDTSLNTFEFTLPYDIEYGNYKIKITSLFDTTFTQVSNLIKITGVECADAVFVPPDINAIPSPGIGANPIPDNNPYNTYESGGYTDVSDDKYISNDQDGNLVILDRPGSTKPLPLPTKASCILPFPRSGKKPIDIFNPRVRFSFGTKSGNQPQNFIVNNCCQLQTYNPN